MGHINRRGKENNAKAAENFYLSFIFWPISSGFISMVCDKCEKKLGKIVTPDPWKSGARNTTESGGRKFGRTRHYLLPKIDSHLMGSLASFKSAEYVKVQFTRRARITVKDVHTKKVYVRCVGRKYWILKDTDNHQLSQCAF